MRCADFEPPRQSGRPAEQLLVEVVADPADCLRNEQRRRGSVEELRDVRAAPTQHPQARECAPGDAAPDPETALPDGEGSPPVRRHFVPTRRQEVEAPADDPGGAAPPTGP